MVVLLAQVAQPNAFEVLVETFAQRFGRLRIAQMSETSSDSVLKRFGIFAVFEHLGIIVGFDYEIAALRNEFLYVVCRTADVGHESERVLAEINAVADVLGCVVRNLKCGYAQVVYAEILTHFYDFDA